MPSHKPLQRTEHTYPNLVVIEAVTDSEIAQRVKGRHWEAFQGSRKVGVFVTWQQTKYSRTEDGNAKYQPFMLRASWVITDEDCSEKEVLAWALQAAPASRAESLGPHPERLFDKSTDGSESWKATLKALPNPRVRRIKKAAAV